MRTQPIALNKHLHRIGAHTTSTCPLCDHPQETIGHHLFHCAPLADLRRQLLPPQLNKKNTLFGNTRQLQATCKYLYMLHGTSLVRKEEEEEVKVECNQESI